MSGNTPTIEEISQDITKVQLSGSQNVQTPMVSHADQAPKIRLSLEERLIAKSQAPDLVANYLKVKSLLKEKIKALKQEKKQAKKLMKAERKEAKKELKAQKKEFKRCKHENSKDRKEGRICKKGERREKKIKEEDQTPFTWPEDAKVLYLDGNNMLFVANALRKLTLKDMRLGEKLLESIARKAPSVLNLDKCTLLFDETPTQVFEDRFFVLSARPVSPTSDDLLVEYAKYHQKANQVAYYVTSDRELQARLEEVGGHILRPKTFLTFLASATQKKEIGESPLGLEEWVDTFVTRD